MRQFHPWKVLNIDETAWKALDNRMLTMAIPWTECVTAPFSGNPKACSIALVTIDAAENKLPLCVAAQGRQSDAKNVLVFATSLQLPKGADL
jgi:hypothetical protein